MFATVILSCLGFAVFALFWTMKPTKYWQKLNLKSAAELPIFGSIAPVKMGMCSMLDILGRYYSTFNEEKCFGFYNMRTRWLIVKDPDLIKRITTTDFGAFHQHRRVIPDGTDPIWDRNIFAMTDQKEWQWMRSALTPAFSPFNMKQSFDEIKQCSEQIVQYLSEKEQPIVVEFEDILIKYASIVMGVTTFGIDCNCIENNYDEFYCMAKGFSNSTGWRNQVITLYHFFPQISKIIKIPFFPKTVTKYFNDLVKKLIDYREEHGIKRPDIIQLLMNERNLGKITHDDITAQALIFFLGGLDTLSIMVCYTFYELAVNPSIQDQLYDEISNAFGNSTDETFTYADLNELDYLDMIMKETLRKWPPFALIDRTSTEPYTIQPSSSQEKAIHLEKHTICVIPVFLLHRDPKYYPDPERFDPDRFRKDKKNIQNYTYIPFGLGPRNCIGTRFALLAAKLITVDIIKKFIIVPTEKTPIPMVFNKKRINAIPVDGFWLELKSRC